MKLTELISAAWGWIGINPVAANRAELEAMSKDQSLLEDWYMEGLVAQAEERLGPLGPGRKYCLKVPGVLGGEYGGDNLASISRSELIDVSGHIARQIHGLPPGTQVQLRITD